MKLSKKNTTTQTKVFEAKELFRVSDERTYFSEGSFGKLCLCFHKDYNFVAVKHLALKAGIRENGHLDEQLQQDMAIFQQVNHECVVPVYGYAVWQGYVGLIMEYLPVGNLKYVLLDVKVVINPFLRLRMCSEIASGISFIHELFRDKNVIHGNVKPENILLTDNLHCKLSDFAWPKLRSNGETKTIAPSPTKRSLYAEIYAAPETWKQITGKLYHKRDTYSFGMTMHMILSRHMPMMPNMPMMLFLKVLENGCRPELQAIDQLKEDLRLSQKNNGLAVIQLLENQMKKCWKHNPSDRPEMTELRDIFCSSLASCDEATLEQEVATAIQSIEINLPSQDHVTNVPLEHIWKTNDFRGSNDSSPTSTKPRPAIRRGTSIKVMLPNVRLRGPKLIKPNPLPRSVSFTEGLTANVTSQISTSTSSSYGQKATGTHVDKLTNEKAKKLSIFDGNRDVSDENHNLSTLHESSDTTDASMPTAHPRCRKLVLSLPLANTSDHIYETIGDLSSDKSPNSPISCLPGVLSKIKAKAETIHESIRKKPGKRATSLPAGTVSGESSTCASAKGSRPSSEVFQKHEQVKKRYSSPSFSPDTPSSPLDINKEFCGSLKDEKQLATKLKSIKVRLGSGSDASAAREITELSKMSTCEFDGDCEVAVEEVLEMVKACSPKTAETTFSILRWTLQLIEGTTSYLKLRLMKACAEACCDTASALSSESLKEDIEKYALPFVETCNRRIKRVKCDDPLFKAEVMSWILLYTARCSSYVDKYALAAELAGEAIVKMKTAFGEEATRRFVLASCYEARASAHWLAGQFDKAVKDYQNELEMLNSAEDMAEEERQMNIHVAFTIMEQTRSLLEASCS